VTPTGEARRVVVTGANSGFGYATALHLARHGFHVHAAIRNLARADPLLAAAADGLPLEVVELDVTSDESVATAFATIAEHGPLDALVNNAGVSASGPFEATPDENRLMFETNYFGALRCIRTVLPAMRTRGQGSIVNITSLSALWAWPNQACYAASKWALEGFSNALAHEVRRFGIHVTTVQPGAIHTEIVANTADRNHFDRQSPYIDVMRRNGKLVAAGFRAGATPDDVAAAVLDALVDPDRHQRPVGADAEAIFHRRAQVSLDDFIALGADVSDEDYRTWFSTNFAIDL
jgi:NAD(P)-dependent dehydrogenase (short-subunit alcohol dehydrogenase family)